MTTKTVLILGGALVGGVLLYEIFKPGSALTRPSTAARTTSNGNVEAGLVSGFVAALGQLASPHGSGAYGTSAAGQSTYYNPSTLAANGGNTNYVDIGGAGYSAGAAGNYGYADTHPGTALPEGVYGPPVPSQDPITSDDGLMSPVYA